jgi:hypothetical protein
MKPFQASVDNPQLRRAALAMNRNDIPQAERLLKAYLHDSPTDVPRSSSRRISLRPDSSMRSCLTG